jgi:hypothetical protein
MIHQEMYGCVSVMLFTKTSDGYGYFKNISVPSDSTCTMVLCLDEKMLFLSSYTVYATVYLEYRGETFIASCRSNIYGMQKCYELTWLKD